MWADDFKTLTKLLTETVSPQLNVLNGSQFNVLFNNKEASMVLFNFKKVFNVEILFL